MQEGSDPKPVEQSTQIVESPSNVDEKVVSVEPAAEGPRMRIKKPLTEAQLEALRKGRKKLAEKRKAAASMEEAETMIKKEDVVLENEDTIQEATEPDDYHSSYCSIM